MDNFNKVIDFNALFVAFVRDINYSHNLAAFIGKNQNIPNYYWAQCYSVFVNKKQNRYSNIFKWTTESRKKVVLNANNKEKSPRKSVNESKT